jgi:Domain of unknown function (DUF929)
VIVRRSLTIGLVCAALLAVAASAAAAPAPRVALLQAQTDARGFAQQARTSAVKQASAASVRELARATFPELWINAREADAPTYGTRVFTASGAAVRDLQRLKRSSGAAIKLIVAADRALATGVINEARGGNALLLAAARAQVSTGDRQAGGDRPGAAVRSYATAWQSAYEALAQLVAARATSVPAAMLADAADNALGSKLIGLAGPMFPHRPPPLTAGGKPEMFFAGSEACPFCGVERWGMIVALAQFGTFSNLQLMQSLPTERPADRTFTFLGASYQSPYIAFEPVEVWSNVRHGFGFAHLQPLSPSQNGLLKQFDPFATTPFIDVANRYVNIDSTVQPKLIAGLSWTQITRALRRPNSVAAQAIGGEAEVLTAELCLATHGAPKSVCSAPIVQQYEAALPLLNGKGGGCPAPATDVIPATGGTPATGVTPGSIKRGGRRHPDPVARAAHCKI